MTLLRKEYQIEETIFYGRRFHVDPRVLVPRKKTETTARIAIETIRQLIQSDGPDLKVADIGTGSGAIIITIASELVQRNIEYYATDVSEDALRVAKQNANHYGLSKHIQFYCSDLFTAFPIRPDVIVANLPYLPHNSTIPPEVKCEPQISVFDAGDGTELAIQLIQQIKAYVTHPKALILENNPQNHEKICFILRKTFSSDTIQIDTYKDDDDLARVIRVIWL